MEEEKSAERVAYSPAWNALVVGSLPAEASGEEETVRFECKRCGAKGAVKCGSGAYRQHVDRFAARHYHRDPFKER